MKIQWILASGSPRRREILTHLGLDFTVLCADVPEDCAERDACRLVEELASRKARAVREILRARSRAEQGGARADSASGTAGGASDTVPPVAAPDEGTVIIAADTVVCDPDGNILGKPHSADDAAHMLRTLSGRTHSVVSGITVVRGETCVTAHERTDVTFDRLTDELIARYVASGEPMDKAGAYGVQDTAALWVTGIRGDYFNVVGLPVHRLEKVLNDSFGLSLWGRK